MAGLPYAVAAALAPLLLAGAAPSATAAPAATLQATVNIVVAVRSLTITIHQPTGNAGCTPEDQFGVVTVLLTPRENCQLPVGTIMITNGALPAQVDVAGSDAVPTNGRTRWTLCGGAGTACTGKHGTPGKDQFQVTTLGGTKKPLPGTILTYKPAMRYRL